MPAWHQQTIEETFRELESSPAGLDPWEAEQRLARHGANELQERHARSPLAMVLAQFSDFLIIVLLAAAGLAELVGEPGDSLTILAIVMINAFIGFAQEYRAARAMAALRRMAGQQAVALRGGQAVNLPASQLVPGDLVLLEAGNVVPADLRLTQTARLSISEAVLTGESETVAKGTDPLKEEDLPLGDRLNIAYKGTMVATGRGAGVVTATGMSTELGKIAKLLQGGGEQRTPLQRRLAAFGRRLGLAILAICALLFFLGFLRGEPPVLMFLTAVSLAVAAIPEALPAVVTIALALGARKMVRLNALIRHLPAVETLGSVTVICSDKTGTLTLNRMTVEELFLEGGRRRPGDPLLDGDDGSNQAVRWFFTGCALCNDAQYTADGGMVGDPTETALLELAQGAGFNRQVLAETFPRVAELPFDAERKLMTTFHRLDSSVVAFTKGAAERVLERCTAQWLEDSSHPLDRQRLGEVVEEMAAAGLRVLAVAMRRWPHQPEEPAPAEVEHNLVLLGLAGLLDPPRPEAAESVALCRQAGIVPVMITGDHPATARTIATRLAILVSGRERVMTGRDLASLGPGELAAEVERIGVFARVAPEQKLAIVRALQERGHFVAMTGDGVNDAPALQRADIGVAMGITGTDVAKESADLILLDDNFATIVRAVREGRRIYANILKFITYSLTANAGTLTAIVAAPLLGLPLPLLPAQILWLNLLTDSLPGLALAVEPAERDVMSRPPVDPREGVFAAGRGWAIFLNGLQIGVVALLLQHYALIVGAPWQTMVFTFLVLNRLVVALTVRSDRISLFRHGLFGNRSLWGAILLVILLQGVVVAVPSLAPLFHTQTLTPLQWATVGLLAIGMLAGSELQKWARRLVQRRSPS